MPSPCGKTRYISAGCRCGTWGRWSASTRCSSRTGRKYGACLQDAEWFWAGFGVELVVWVMAMASVMADMGVVQALAVGLLATRRSWLLRWG